MKSLGQPHEPLRVGQLNRLAREFLEGRFSQCWVRGELIALSIPSSGHWYFTLKDAEGQISCALFKYRAPKQSIAVGTEVVVQGQISLYEARGQYQMIIESIVPWGLGERHVAMEELKKKLLLEGVLKTEGHRTLPAFPRCIAIVSSEQAAGFQDVLVILKRRFPLARLRFYPTLVQGEQAPAAIIRALNRVERDQAKIDVVMIIRGGGSPEDLWCFNDEALVRKVASLSKPSLSGIGHAIDLTLTDLAVDVRAPTPSAAAELVVPDAQELHLRLRQQALRIERLLRHRVERSCMHLDALRARLISPKRHIDMQRQRLMTARMLQDRTLRHRLYLYHQHLQRLHRQWMQSLNLDRWQNNLKKNSRRFEQNILTHLQNFKMRLLRAQSTWQAREPFALLKSGWAMVRDASGQHPASFSQMSPESRWKIAFPEGLITVQVIEQEKI